MEHLVVEYYRRRGVLMDGEPAGFTNEDIETEEGTYTVTLAGSPNYTPKRARVAIRDTTVLAPMVVHFDPA